MTTDLTTKAYEQHKKNCKGLCDIDHDRIAASNPKLMPCVTCPFCKKVVTAELTPTTIHCPACKTTVARS